MRSIRPQQTISYQDWVQIEDRAKTAILFMKKTNPLYIMMQNDLKEAETIVLENRVHEVREVRVLNELLQKVFVTPKQEQLDEVIGQIKYLRLFFSEMESWIYTKKDLENQEAEGRIIIERDTKEQA